MTYFRRIFETIQQKARRLIWGRPQTIDHTLVWTEHVRFEGGVKARLQEKEVAIHYERGHTDRRHVIDVVVYRQGDVLETYDSIPTRKVSHVVERLEDHFGFQEIRSSS